MKDINFLNDEANRKKSGLDIEDLRDRIEPKSILIGIVVVLGLIVVFFAPLLFNMIKAQRLNGLQSDYNDKKYAVTKQVMQSIGEEKGKIEQKKGAITNIDKASINFTEIYSALTALLPAGCTLKNISFDGTRVNISGSYVEDIQIGEIITRAKRLDFFVIDDKTAISYSPDKNFDFSFGIKGKEVK